MAQSTTTRDLDESSYEDWSRLIAASPHATPYTHPDYLDALCRAAGGRFRIVGVFRGDQLVGGVPLYETRDGPWTVARPRLLLYYTSPVLESYQTKYPSQSVARQLETLSCLAARLRDERYGEAILKCAPAIGDVRPFLAEGWSASFSYTYTVEIADIEAAWSRVEQNLRRLVKRASSEGFECVSDDDFSSFFALHADTIGRKGAGVYLPEAAFREFFQTLHRQGRARLYHVRARDGRAVASQLVLLGDGGMSHTVCAGALQEFNKLGASALLRWKAFESLSRDGYTRNDLTDAALNPVTKFKSQLGGDLTMCPVLTHQRSAYGAWKVTERVRSVPLGVARRIRNLLTRRD